MRFDFETMRAHYGESIGSYQGRLVYVGSKYDDIPLGGSYCLFDYNNALVIDGTLVGSISVDGRILKRDKAVPWRLISKDFAEGEPSAPPQSNANEVDLRGADIDKVLYNAMKAPINVQSLSTGYANADELLKSAYDGIYDELSYKE